MYIFEDNWQIIQSLDEYTRNNLFPWRWAAGRIQAQKSRTEGLFPHKTRIDGPSSIFSNEERLRRALEMVLREVDYTNGACSVTEMVGAVLPREVIEIARTVLAETTPRIPEYALEALRAKVWEAFGK